MALVELTPGTNNRTFRTTTQGTSYQGFQLNGGRNLLITVSGAALLLIGQDQDGNAPAAAGNNVNQPQDVPTGLLVLRAPGSKLGAGAITPEQIDPGTGVAYKALDETGLFSIAAASGTITLSVTILNENVSR